MEHVPHVFSEHEAEIVAALRGAREAITRMERLLGFCLESKWRPITIASETPVRPGERRWIIGRNYHYDALRGRAIVVHGNASRFDLYDLRVGKNSQEGFYRQESKPFPCVQFAYDNPPRLFNLELVQVSQDISFAVQNTGDTDEMFRATVWGEADPPCATSPLNELLQAAAGLHVVLRKQP